MQPHYQHIKNSSCKPHYQHTEGAVPALTSLTRRCWFLTSVPSSGTQCLPCSLSLSFCRSASASLCQVRSSSKAARACLPSHETLFNAHQFSTEKAPRRTHSAPTDLTVVSGYLEVRNWHGLC